MEQEMRENVEELVEAAKKVGKSAKKVGVEKGKEVVEKSKKVAKKAAAKVEEVTKEVIDMFDKTNVNTVIQANGMEINHDDIVKRVKDNYRELSESDDRVEELNLYIKPDENAVYYVVNQKYTGKINIV